QLGHQIRPKPAVLLIKNQEATMASLVQRGEREHSKPHTQDVGNRSALTLEHIFSIAVALDPEFDRCRLPLEVRFSTKANRLVENFLQSDGQLFLNDA